MTMIDSLLQLLISPVNRIEAQFAFSRHTYYHYNAIKDIILGFHVSGKE